MGFVAPLIAGALAGGGAAAAGASAATALTVGATALAGLSSWQQTKYQGYVARNNALVAERNAARTAEAAQIEQMRSDREYAAMISETLAEQSASGFDVLGRSQLRVRERMAKVGGMAAKDIRKQGEYDTADQFQEAANFRSEARALKAKGITDLAGTALSIGTTLSKDKGFTSMIGRARSRKGGIF